MPALAATLVLILPAGAPSQNPSPEEAPTVSISEEPKTARGSFEVKMSAEKLHEAMADPRMARLSLDKTFEGDLVGSSKGEMLSLRSAVQGSAGYVALELVEGELGGKAGSFVLQHSGTMNRGEPSLEVTVVPDSGTGELEGLVGRMTIDVGADGHRYAFEYSLPD